MYGVKNEMSQSELAPLIFYLPAKIVVQGANSVLEGVGSQMRAYSATTVGIDEGLWVRMRVVWDIWGQK